jgi:hypothetical protein
MCTLTAILKRSGGYGSPQPLSAGGMLESGVGVGAGVGTVIGGAGVVGVAGEPPHASCAARALAAKQNRTEESSFTRAP